MSTQLRRFAQAPAHSPARAKFFLVLADISGAGAPAAGDSVIRFIGTDFQSAMSETAFDAQFDGGAGITLTTNTVLKDLGREVVVYSDVDPSNHLYKYRQVQIVSGAGSEGVFDSAATTAPNPWQSNIFVLVWSASGAGVSVARTG
jgi:hypothetical protein